MACGLYPVACSLPGYVLEAYVSLICGDKPSLSGGEGTLEWTLPCFEVFDRSKLRRCVDFLIFVLTLLLLISVSHFLGSCHFI